MRRIVIAGIFGGLAVVGISLAAAVSALSKKEQPDLSNLANSSDPVKAERTIAQQGGGAGLNALDQAAQAKKYLFAFFWKDESEDTARMKKVFGNAMQKVAERADSISVCVTDIAERAIVEKFGLDRAPMPLILAIAPNGAIMGCLPKKCTEENLIHTFGSPCTEECMKTMQEGNLVLLCVQNKSTTSNEEAMKGIREFATDQRYASATKIVMLDPSNPTEKPFLTDLKIDPQTSEAITAFLAPPGSVIAEFKGATDKEDLIAALQKARTGCGPGGCGPGGCGPQK